MNRTSHTILLGALCAGCWSPADDAPASAGSAEPPAAIAQISSATPLDQALEMLQQELTPALEREIGDAVANERLLRAEAITDRLLETRLPFEWLADDNYALDSRLRQIQALADRITAQIRSGAPRDSVRADVRTLLGDVSTLRAAIARGGTRAPPTLDQLLSDFEANRRRPPPARPPAAAPPAARDTTG